MATRPSSRRAAARSASPRTRRRRARRTSVTVPALADVEGPVPNQVRVMSVTGGTLTQADGSGIGFGAGGSLLALSRRRRRPALHAGGEPRHRRVRSRTSSSTGRTRASTRRRRPRRSRSPPVNDPPVLTGNGRVARRSSRTARPSWSTRAPRSPTSTTPTSKARPSRSRPTTANGEDTLSFTDRRWRHRRVGREHRPAHVLRLRERRRLPGALRSVTYANWSENPAASRGTCRSWWTTAPTRAGRGPVRSPSPR